MGAIGNLCFFFVAPGLPLPKRLGLAVLIRNRRTCTVASENVVAPRASAESKRRAPRIVSRDSHGKAVLRDTLVTRRLPAPVKELKG